MEFFIILIALCIFAALSLRANHNDAAEQLLYHRLQPAEDGCVHELGVDPLHLDLEAPTDGSTEETRCSSCDTTIGFGYQPSEKKLCAACWYH